LGQDPIQNVMPSFIMRGITALLLFRAALVLASLVVGISGLSVKHRTANAFGISGLSRKHRTTNAFNCATYPKMCEAPFNCDKDDGTISYQSMWLQGMAVQGPYMKSWCDSADYQDYAYECLVTKDLVKAGHIQYNNTKAGKFAPNAFELVGSYCFIEGHCLNTAVTNSTTLEEANLMCDERYGHERWARYGSSSSSDIPSDALVPKDSSNGFEGQQSTTTALVAACAMGNYHCDVIYCKETYCKDEYMVKKYGHWLQDLGWTESTASWMHA